MTDVAFATAAYITMITAGLVHDDSGSGDATGTHWNAAQIFGEYWAVVTFTCSTKLPKMWLWRCMWSDTETTDRGVEGQAPPSLTPHL